jgi:hypothetical protein
MIKKIMKLVEESFDEEVSSTIDTLCTGDMFSAIEGKEAFYKSLKQKLEKFLSEDDDLDDSIKHMEADIDSLTTIKSCNATKSIQYDIFSNDVSVLPFDEAGRSQRQFLHFPIGTDRDLILNWIKLNCK